MIAWLLKKILPFKDLGWKEIGEEFTRFTVLKTPWLRVYLHRLKCETWPPRCHDHPWTFVSVILAGGYLEMMPGARIVRRGRFSVLYRQATFSHNVKTEGNNVCWSLVFATRKTRDWGFNLCESRPTKEAKAA
jgi:hypothetical protein